MKWPRPATRWSSPSGESRWRWSVWAAASPAAVTFASGYTHGMTWRRFIVADVCAGLLWGTYAAMLGYLGIYAGTAAGGESATPVATGITATTFTVNGLVPGTAYYYTVKTVAGGLVSAASNEASDSRIFAGQHFRYDENAGQALGAQVAHFVVDHSFGPQGDRGR